MFFGVVGSLWRGHSPLPGSQLRVRRDTGTNQRAGPGIRRGRIADRPGQDGPSGARKRDAGAYSGRGRGRGHDPEETGLGACAVELCVLTSWFQSARPLSRARAMYSTCLSSIIWLYLIPEIPGVQQPTACGFGHHVARPQRHDGLHHLRAEPQDFPTANQSQRRK